MASFAVPTSRSQFWSSHLKFHQLQTPTHGEVGNCFGEQYPHVLQYVHRLDIRFTPKTFICFLFSYIFVPIAMAVETSQKHEFRQNRNRFTPVFWRLRLWCVWSWWMLIPRAAPWKKSVASETGARKVNISKSEHIREHIGRYLNTAEHIWDVIFSLVLHPNAMEELENISSLLRGSWKFPTVDGWNPANHLRCMKPCR